MTVQELIDLLIPYKDNINEIPETENLEITLENGVLEFNKFKVKYICDRCTSIVEDSIDSIPD
jgi:hypothetical protein